MVCCSIWINSTYNAGMKSVMGLAAPHTFTIFLPALLALLIPNTTANHTITYTNPICILLCTVNGRYSLYVL